MTKEQIWVHLSQQIREASSKASGMWRYDLLLDNIFKLPKLEDIVIPHWKLFPIVGKSPEKEFWYRLSRGIFNINQNLRDEQHLEYLEERDLFHDLFGHCPSLFDTDYTNYLISIGQYAQHHKNNPTVDKILSSIYWYTAEFGLIEERGENRVLGAGILSSKSELQHVVNGPANIMPFDFDQVASIKEYVTNGFQTEYFVIPGKKAFSDIIKKLWKYNF